VVTRDVPDGELAVGRARQKNFPARHSRRLRPGGAAGPQTDAKSDPQSNSDPSEGR
jgi:hypothetical protein